MNVIFSVLVVSSGPHVLWPILLALFNSFIGFSVFAGRTVLV